MATEAWANVEAGLLIETSPAAVRGAFASSRLELCETSLDRVAELEFEAEEEGPQAPLLLRAARLLKDERVELAVDGAIPAETLVTAGLEAQPLGGDHSDAPLALPEGCARVALRCERKSPVQLRCAR